MKVSMEMLLKNNVFFENVKKIFDNIKKILSLFIIVVSNNKTHVNFIIENLYINIKR